MQELADRLNISKNAISLALNGKPGVSESTRTQVLALAKELNYTLTHSESVSPANNILVLIPEYLKDDSYFYNEIYWSVDHYAKAFGYNAMMTLVPDSLQTQPALPPICADVSYAGLLLIGIFKQKYVQYLLSQTPYVLSVDQCYYGLNVNCILTANIDGGYLLTQRVIEKGHRRIGFIGSIRMTSSIYERFIGFRHALDDADIPLNEAYCICKDSPLNVLFSNSDELTALIHDMPELPTAFVCSSDRMAIACIEALKRLDICVPVNISVVGFDDTELSKIIVPKLTTMQVKRKEMGQTAVDALIHLTADRPVSRRLSLMPEYVERESLWPLHKA